MFHSQFPIVSCSDNYFNAVKLFIISKILAKNVVTETRTCDNRTIFTRTGPLCHRDVM